MCKEKDRQEGDKHKEKDRQTDRQTRDRHKEKDIQIRINTKTKTDRQTD